MISIRIFSSSYVSIIITISGALSFFKLHRKSKLSLDFIDLAFQHKAFSTKELELFGCFEWVLVFTPFALLSWF